MKLLKKNSGMLFFKRVGLTTFFVFSACSDPADPPPDPAGARASVTSTSASGPDGFYGVIFDNSGSFYATGFSALSTDSSADRSMIVAKYTSIGMLDTTFGTHGVATHNVAVGGKAGEMARGIVIQSTGKIVIAGSIEHDVAATGQAASDRDIALVRFNTNGTVDTTFGTNGVVVLDLNTGIETTNSMGAATWSGADAVWSLSVYDDDKLLVHGVQRAEGFKNDGVTPRSDTDWALVRLTSNGGLDSSFATNGKFTLDIEQGSAQVRSARILADDSIIAAGYTTTTSINTVQPVLYKVTSAGQLDTSFGTNGIFHQVVLTTIAEAYDVGVQGTKFVTAGYGRATTSESLDWLSIRVGADGKLDTTYGTNGITRIDEAGYNDNARALVVLSDQRVLIVGGGRPTTDNVDAMIAMLTPNGQLDTRYIASGKKLYDLGGIADMFWGCALSPDHRRVAVVGLRGAGTTQTASNNDDAAVLVLPTGL